MRKPSLGRRLKAAIRAITGAAFTGASSVFQAAGGGNVYGDWIAPILYPDDISKWSPQKIRGRCQDLARNNAFVRCWLNLMSNNVVGHAGFVLQSNVMNGSGDSATPAEMINKKIEMGWAEWSGVVTVDGRQTLAEFLRCEVENRKRDGETFTRLHRNFPHNRFGFALEPIDPGLVAEEYSDVLRNGNIITAGVERDGIYGRRVSYHIWNQPPNTGRNRKRESIPADQIIHVLNAERPNQQRGYSPLVACANDLKTLDRYFENELVASAIAAAKGGFFVNDDPNAPVGEVTTNPDGSVTKPVPTTMEANPGVAEALAPGWKFQEWDPKHPALAFASFIKAVGRKISSALGVPYNVLFSDWESISWSSMRSAELNAREIYRTEQQKISDQLLYPIFGEWLSISLLKSALVLDNRPFERFLECEFIPRGWSWVDPQKDIDAAVTAIQNGLGCEIDVVAEQGQELEDVYKKLARARALRAKYGIPEPAGITPKAAAPDNQGAAVDATAQGAGVNGNGRNRIAALNGGTY
jgi:lambda family phage portal protein